MAVRAGCPVARTVAPHALLSDLEVVLRLRSRAIDQSLAQGHHSLIGTHGTLIDSWQEEGTRVDAAEGSVGVADTALEGGLAHGEGDKELQQHDKREKARVLELLPRKQPIVEHGDE